MGQWIAVDWGTSRLRAWAIDDDGRITAHGQVGQGAGRLAPDGYEPALLALIGPWLEGDAPVEVVVAGMAGRRGGWCEVPYVEVPCGLDGLAAGCTQAPVQDRRLLLWIVPGLCQHRPSDVMRGEETQLLGLLKAMPRLTGSVCLPGTHSKWVRLADGRIEVFTTYMTGEAFALLTQHSILKDLVEAEGEPDADAFLAGVRAGTTAPEALLANTFSVRAGALLHQTEAAHNRARLSGLLIGTEIAAARPVGTVTLIGTAGLAGLYAKAIRAVGGEVVSVPAETATVDGLRAIHAARGGGS